MDEMDIAIDIENADLEEQIAEESSEQVDDTANTELEKVLLISETAIANKSCKRKIRCKLKLSKD